MKKYSSIAAFVLAAGCLSASAITVTFEGLAHGTVVNSQFAASHGLTISANNLHRDWDIAMIFDTTQLATEDSDLEDPFTGGNLPSTTFMGSALIIQEGNDGIPDDEGRRPAGSLYFQFNHQATSFGFDVIDVENTTQEGSSLVFRLGSSIVESVSFATLAVLNGAQWGNNSLNHIAAYSPTGAFDRVEIMAGGSMAFDNITWNVPDAGATLMLCGLSALALGAFRRRS